LQSEEQQKINIKNVLAFRKLLTDETDRGCALYASAFLDKALSELISTFLVDDKKKQSELFEGNAPLSSFSARIKMAFYLGKISKIEKRDFDLIRKIRNEFAHNAEEINFDKENIRNQCRELSFSYHPKEHRSRGHFTAACLGLLANIHNETQSAKAFKVKSENAPTKEQKKKIINKVQDKINTIHASTSTG
jgi:DNA-binding MltR family transcriptional regulator